MRNAFRDFFRRRRVARHLAEHGPVFDYHGLTVTVPPEAGLSAMNALIRGKYERDEAALILKHLPSDQPVIELGGSLGVVSKLAASRLAPGTPHLIVEANEDLLPACRANAGEGLRSSMPRSPMTGRRRVSALARKSTPARSTQGWPAAICATCRRSRSRTCSNGSAIRRPSR
ncbi:MAG: hypothetical protein K5872_20515 [Rhizobiaceae bacterium]|nr:hypothetical protein [Rhizobiaceae bacterium]MCV0408603.1 hypothetical protein [Rhizobiaceae bacterium]